MLYVITVVATKAVVDMDFNGFVLIVKNEPQKAKNFLTMKEIVIEHYGEDKADITNENQHAQNNPCSPILS